MAVVVDSMPVLSRGKHRHPGQGACFMEYTALLAGERFSDAPSCVDRELAEVMRHANDKVSDTDRPRLVPLLGRSIGLVVQPPVGTAGRPGRSGRSPDRCDQDMASYRRSTAALRRAVSRRLMAALECTPTDAEVRLHGGGTDVSGLFWFLMHEPTVLSTSASYVSRLIDRLHLLHECYEQAMDELGLVRSAAVGHTPADVRPPLESSPR